MTTIPALDPVTDILDTDLVMVTNAQGNSYTIAGSELNKRNKIIMASNITVTGAPLKAGGSVRIYFSADITANDGNTVMQINYNGVNYYVKAPKDGGLINFVAHAVGNVYKYVQAYTTLEMLFDGNQFVIIGNPVVISNSDYVINADGSITYNAPYIIKGTYCDYAKYLSLANKKGYKGLVITYYNLAYDSIKLDKYYLTKNDSNDVVFFKALGNTYTLEINGNNIVCTSHTDYAYEANWTIEFWSGRKN